MEKNKELVIKILNDLKNYSKRISDLYDLGIDLINFSTKLEGDLIFSIPYILSANDHNASIEDIEWWLYEVDKIIYIGDQKIDVSTTEAYVDWLFDQYISIN